MSQDDRIEVQFGAQTSELDSAAQKAVADVQKVADATSQAGQKSAGAWSGFGNVFKGVSDAISGGFGKIAEGASGMASSSGNAFKAIGESANAMQSGVTGAFGQLSGTLAGVQGMFAGIAAALAGGAAFKHGIDAVKEQTAEAMKLSRALGITAEQANILNTALGNVFLDSDTYINGVRSVTRALSTNADGFREMGIATKDSQGHMLPMQEIITNTVHALDEYKAGVDRNVMAQQLLGRNYEDLIRLSKLNEEVMAGAKQEVEDYHKQLDPAMVKAYKEAMENAGDAVEGVTLAVGRGAMPVFTEIAQWFQETGPTSTAVTIEVMGALVDIWDAVKGAAVTTWEVLKEAFSQIGNVLAQVFRVDALNASEFIVNCFKVVHIAVTFLATGFELAFEGIRVLLELAGSWVDRFSRVTDAALRLDWSGIKSAWESGTADVERIVAASAVRIGKIEEEGQRKIEQTALGTPETKAPSEAPKSNGKRNAKPLGQTPANDTADKVPSYMQTYEAELAEQKLLYEKQNNLRQMSKEEELAYWRDILSTYQVTSKDQVQIVKKTAELELQVMREKAKRAQELKKEEIDAIEQEALDGVQMEESAAQLQVATYGMTTEHLLELQRQFEDRRYQIQAMAQAERIALLQQDPNADPVALQTQQDKLLQLTRQYELKKQQLDLQGAQQSMQIWQDLSSRMSGLWDKGIDAMMNGTLRWRNALRAVGTEALGWFANSVVKPMVAQWLIGENTKSAATSAGEAIRKALGFSGLAAAQGNTMADATTKVSAEAVKTEAGVTSSWASTGPWGLAIGLALGAAAAAGILGLMGKIHSAAGGFDIPSGMSPVTQLHEEEMVLPKGIANPLRKMIAGGQGGGEQIDAAPPANMTVNYHDNSGRLSRAQIRENARTIAEELNRVHRDGWRPA
jgi:hypothetical protein